MRTIYDNEFQLEKFVKKVSNINDTRVGVIYGLNHIDSSKIMRDIIELSIDNKYLPNWTSISEADHFEFTNDIKNLLLENVRVENLSNTKIQKRKRKWSLRQNLLVSYVKYRINEVNQVRERISEKVSGKSRNIFWPVLTTVSSFGMAMGVPLFSTLMFRQEQIIDGYGPDHKGALGQSFFDGILVLAIFLIAVAIAATLANLINTIVSNSREYAWKNIDKVFEKLIKTFFITPEEQANIDKLGWFKRFMAKWKFLIKNRYFFFYTDLDPSSKDYEEKLNLLKILQKNGSSVIYSVTNMQDLDVKRITRNILNDDNSVIFRLNEYKNSVNIKNLVNFIFYQITLLSGISTKKLMRDYPLFVHALYRFIDNSISNKQLLDLCIILKFLVGENSKILIPSANIDYFVDLFVLSVLKGLEPVVFGRLLNDIINYGMPSKGVSDNSMYQNLRIDELLNSNLIKYQSNSILFTFKEFMNRSLNLKKLVYSEGFLNPEINSKEQELEEIKKALSYRGYQEVTGFNNPNYDGVFRSEYNEEIYLKFLSNKVLQDDHDLLKVLSKILDEAKTDKISSFIIDLFGVKYFYQMIDYRYELIPETFS